MNFRGNLIKISFMSAKPQSDKSQSHIILFLQAFNNAVEQHCNSPKNPLIERNNMMREDSPFKGREVEIAKDSI